MTNLASERRWFSTFTRIPLAPVFGYWADRYVMRKMELVAGVRPHRQFYANACMSVPRDKLQVLSIGSGDGEMDLKVGRLLADCGRLGGYDCVEFAPPRVARANEAFQKAGLGNLMRSREADLSQWEPSHTYDAIIATQILHHVVDLEGLFAKIADALAPGGVFATIDMIGRNGHQCWPEVLEYVESIWSRLPSRYKYNHIFKRQDELFVNRDCSEKTNEGIRAQDILPMLLERFQFRMFIADGGVIDPFTERLYGPNYSLDLDEDRSIIDSIAFLNESLLDVGAIKPTMMRAVMTREPAEPKVYRHWTPQFCVRRPG